jgi:hypothetical protein
MASNNLRKIPTPRPPIQATVLAVGIKSKLVESVRQINVHLPAKPQKIVASSLTGEREKTGVRLW